MIAVQETTVWDSANAPNHVYLMDGDKMVAYIRQGTNDPFYFKNPIRIDRRGRKFVELKANPFKAVARLSNTVKVAGSKGSTYEVDLDAKSCTCPGFTFRGACKHITELCK